jgi:hypothetical protein
MQIICNNDRWACIARGVALIDIQLLSFGLAILVGVICFALVKQTADEFDRWYEEPKRLTLRIPAIVVSLAIVGLLLVVLH